jgi:hypothetical protein
MQERKSGPLKSHYPNRLEEDMASLKLIFEGSDSYKIYRSMLTPADSDLVIRVSTAYFKSEDPESEARAQEMASQFENKFREAIRDRVYHTRKMGFDSFEEDHFSAMRWDLYLMCDELDFHPGAKYMFVSNMMEGINRAIEHRKFIESVDRFVIPEEDRKSRSSRPVINS